MENLLHIPETLLPEDPATARIEGGEDPARVAADLPSSSLPWAVLAQTALDGGRSIEAYAYARTGYHRGLDALRGSGWKGQGPVPWSHVPNRGFLRALAALSQAAGEIEETAEQERCRNLLIDSSAEGAQELLG